MLYLRISARAGGRAAAVRICIAAIPTVLWLWAVSPGFLATRNSLVAITFGLIAIGGDKERFCGDEEFLGR